MRIDDRSEIARDVDIRVAQRAQVLVDLDAAIVASRQLRPGHEVGRLQAARPDERPAFDELTVFEPEAFLGSGADYRLSADLHAQVSEHPGGLVDQLRGGAGQDRRAGLD